MAARSFLGAGDIYIERLVGGVSQGRTGPFLADQFEIQPAVEVREKTSKGRYTYGQVVDAVNLAQPTNFTVALSEVQGEALVMAFMGSSSAVSVAAGAVDATIVVSKVGSWLDVGNKNLEQAIAVTNQAGTTTYVEGTDYQLNRPLGWIRAIPGGAITAASTIEVSGAHKGHSGTSIKGSTQTEVRARIVFDGINQVDQQQCTVDVYEAIVAAESSFDFLGDEFGNVTLTGRLKTPEGKDTPFEVLMQDPVA